MKVFAIIPARYGSVRFPGKPLARETGKYLIEHVCEQAGRARSVSNVIVATDDQRIADAVATFGGRAVMTRADHPSGTDRLAECARTLGLADGDLVVNVQGDEPEMDPGHIDRLVARMTEVRGCRMGTLACPFPADGPREGADSPLDPNRVKVVVDAAGMALYFSRSLIPYPRDTGGRVDDPSRWLLHLGIYAYRVELLKAFTGLGHGGARSNVEDVERLEQLRALEWERSEGPAAGGIAVGIVERATPGVDTPEDYAAFVGRWRGRRGETLERAGPET